MSQLPPIILASASPRRRALLEGLGLPIEVRVSRAKERENGQGKDIALENARAKRDAVLDGAEPGAIVIAADTVVMLDDHVLGKPVDESDARRMLQLLSGRTHSVVTGVAVAVAGSSRTAEGAEETHVTFCALRAEDIQTFIEIVQPFDRAGAYTCDGPGSLLIERFDGCFYNVLGLPIVRLHRLLLELDIDLFSRLDAEWARFL
ncbi:MAG: Maf family nucleotide pyrophosphatase, partial [Candidatus Hydrogenedentales bacterium]